MTPVICFYENDLMIRSDDYTRLECSYEQDPTTFLKQIQLEYPTQMKVIQVNFDYLQKQSIDSLLENDFAITIYALNTFKLINKNDLSSEIEKIDFGFSPRITKEDFIDKNYTAVELIYPTPTTVCPSLSINATHRVPSGMEYFGNR